MPCVIWAGDININLLENPIESDCSEYLRIAAEHQLLPAITEATRGKSCLDHVFVNTDSALGLVINSAITDHAICMLGLSKAVHSPPQRKRTMLKVSYPDLVESLKGIDWSLVLEKANVNDAVSAFDKILASAVASHSRMVMCSRRKFNLKPWITPGLMRCQKNRDMLHLKARNDPNNKILQKTYTRYRNFFKELLRRIRTNYEKAELLKNKNNPKKLWQTINNICDNNKPTNDSSKLVANNLDPSSELNQYNNYFVNVGKNLADKILDQCSSTEINFASRFRSRNTTLNSFFMFPTDCSEIYKIIMGLKVGSAPGIDGYSVALIKEINDFILVPLTYICNLSLSTGCFPESWKLAVVVPIYKDGPKNIASNYRPISLLCIFSKILEKVVNRRLVDYLETGCHLSEKQFGFRRGRSTEDAAVLLTNTVSTALDNSLCCLGIFLDLAKAFDTVSTRILANKLESIGIRGIALHWFLSYLNNRKQCVRVGQSVSDPFSICYGVPQGSILGPTLFSIYMNDILLLNIPNTKIICYADDTVVVFQASSWESVFNAAETGFKTISSWLRLNLLTLNTKKTKFITFYKTCASKPIDTPPIRVHSCNLYGQSTAPCNCTDYINHTNSIRYLGVDFDVNLSFKLHIHNLSARVRKTMYIMKALRHSCDKKTLQMVYCAIVQSILNYCSLIWGGAPKTFMMELERAQRAVLKVMLGKSFRFSTDTLYREAEVLRVRQLFVAKATAVMHSRVVNSDSYNDLLKKRVYKIPAPATRTEFARRHPSSILPRIYNSVSRGCDIKTLTTAKLKRVLPLWLATRSYDETEELVS